jgi:aryl-alcohol dehydrogenase-like predicted oxidoreductase
MHYRPLGTNGPMVSQIGIGCMGMSGIYGTASRAESLATLACALDAGINLIDTGDFYGMGHNELLIGEFLKGRDRSRALLSVKFGAMRDAAGRWLGFDARPAAVKNFLAYTLQRLGVDYIDIYRPARVDPGVPIEETVGAIADCVQAGYVRYIGLSEAGPDTIRRAAAVHPICDLQIEYSLISRGIETAILPACRDLGIGITAYGVLSRGLLAGSWSTGARAGEDMRAHMPRFEAGNLEHNLALVAALRTLAHTRGANGAQLAIAWVMAQGSDIVPVLGARTRDQLAVVRSTLDLTLGVHELQAIDTLVAQRGVAGDRYAPAQMAHLDSEHPAR